MAELYGGIDYGKLREKLKEELKGNFLKVFKPPITVDGVEVVRFADPEVVLHPDTDQPLLIFSGLGADNAWRLYIGELTPDFTARNVRTLLTMADIGGNAIGGQHTMYDHINEEWLITTLQTTTFDVALVRMDKDLKTVKGYQTILTGLTDAGAALIPQQDRRLMLVSVKSGTPYFTAWEISNYTSRPIPSPTEIGRISSPFGRPCCHDTHIRDGWLETIYETIRWNWSLRYGIAPIDLTYYKNVLMVESEEPLLPYSRDWGMTAFLQPRLTVVNGKPVLFFIWARYCCGEHRNEIWAWIPPPDFFKPESHFPLTAELLSGETGVSKAIATFNARALVVYVNASTSGTFKLYEADTLAELIDGSPVETDESIGAAGVYKFIYNYPMRFIRVETDFTATVRVSLK